MYAYQKQIQNSKKAALIFSLFLMFASVNISVNANASERKFYDAKITIDLSKGGQVTENSTIQDPRQIKDKTFVNLDLKVIVDSSTAENIRRIVDQGLTDEAAKCIPKQYAAMDMEDGLRYFFSTNQIDGSNNSVTVQATIYPGERSRNPYNDVFCEYDKNLGDTKAVFRIRGFFFIRHSEILDGIDVQLRPVNLSEDETNRFF